MKLQPSPEAFRRVGHVLARLYRDEVERERDEKRKDRAA